MKRKITFVEGDVATYNLTSFQLDALVRLASLDSFCNKVAENVYRVRDLEWLQDIYDLFISPPEEDDFVFEVYFFTGDYSYQTMTDEELEKRLENVKKRFSCSRLTSDVYKIHAL